MSPGGSTPNSRRSRPELPPSSVTVTMAVTVSLALAPVSSLGMGAESLEHGREASAAADRDDAGRGLATSSASIVRCRAEKGSGVRSWSVERRSGIHDAC